MGDVHSFGPFRLDLGIRELRREGTVVPLTPKAFELLRVLIAGSGRAISKDELLGQVWPDTFVGEDTLTQNIATLRKALGDVSDRPRFIVTVPRYGYRFAGAAEPVSQELHPPQIAPQRADGSRGRRRTIVALAVVGTMALALVFAAFLYGRRASDAPPIVRLEVEAPPGTSFSPSASYPAVSPDGRLVAFLAARPGDETRLWVRSLDSVVSRELPDTAGALGPFWSPDSRFVAFFAKGALRKVGVFGEPPETLCECVSRDVLSGAWHANGVILFVRPEGIFRVSASGGLATQVTSMDTSRGETAHVLPYLLPDGRHFLYTARTAIDDAFESWIMVRSLDAADDRRLFSAQSQAIYTDDGEIIFVHDGELVAERFDASGLKPSGPPMRIDGTEHVGLNPGSPRAMFSASRQTLAYRSAPLGRLEWFDGKGNSLGAIGETSDRDPVLSHDGTRVAVSRLDAVGGRRSIWILDAMRAGIATRLTTGVWDRCPVWSPDDTNILFARGAPNEEEIYVTPTGPSGAPKPLPQRVRGCPQSWSADGLTALYLTRRTANANGEGLWSISVTGPHPPTPVPGTTPAGPRGSRGQISPNGQWVAYEGDSGGRREVFVRALTASAAGQTWRISQNGGMEPQWSADGKELFYLAADKSLMAVPVVAGRTFEPGTPVALFATGLDTSAVEITGRNQYAASANGQRFLLRQAARDAPSTITVVVNWRAAEKR